MVRVSARDALAMTIAMLTVSLAGCVGGGGPADAADDPTGPVDFSEDTGAIQGVVLDTEQVPLADAHVGLPDLDRTAATDENGAFSFSNVPPGTHTLFAQRLGYESVGQRVNVVAGDVIDVQITLSVIPVEEPYQIEIIQDGLFGCGVRVDPVIGVAVCGVLSLYLNLTQYDQFLLTWELPEPTDPWETGVFETEWESNQILGRGLRVYWEVLGCSNDEDFRFDRTEGVNPIIARSDAEDIEDIIENGQEDDPSCNDAPENCHEEACFLQSRTFAAANTTGQDVDVGFTFQQRYRQYLSAFYYEAAPEDYSAIPDE